MLVGMQRVLLRLKGGGGGGRSRDMFVIFFKHRGTRGVGTMGGVVYESWAGRVAMATKSPKHRILRPRFVLKLAVKYKIAI